MSQIVIIILIIVGILLIPILIYINFWLILGIINFLRNL